MFMPFGPLHPHLVFEVLAYSIGFWCYRRLRRRSPDFLHTTTRWSLLVAAAVGAGLGSKFLVLFIDPSQLGLQLSSPTQFMASGKTMVGGLLGGWAAIEWTKSRLGIRERTGDLYALPLCIGVAVGRIGCFLSGLPDRTYGFPSNLPWAVDFGDGIPRHPTQLYEILFLVLLGLHIAKRMGSAFPRGALFREFAVGYLAFRLAIDFLKPAPTLAGLGAIQWACAAALVLQLYHRLRP